jgi:hypothetical protein
MHTLHEIDAVDVIPGAYMGKKNTIETVISAGSSTLAGDDIKEDSEPVSLIQHMTKMGRRGSNHEASNNRNSNTVTILKEVYIREEHVGDPQQIV